MICRMTRGVRQETGRTTFERLFRSEVAPFSAGAALDGGIKEDARMASRREMAQYAVAVKNEPGQLHMVAQALADEGINVQGLVGETMGDVGCVRFLAEKSPRVKRCLEDLGAAVIEDPVVTVLLRDRPGELARAAKVLAEAGVNVKSAYATCGDGEHARLVLSADQPEKARRILAELSEPAPAAV